MLAEVPQFRAIADGKSLLATLLNRAESGKDFHRPVLDWIAASRFDAPALVFDTESIAQRMQWLGRLAQDLSITPLVAVKSCPEPEYLGLASAHLGGFDVSNHAEYACLPDGSEGKLVSVTAPDLAADLGNFISRGNPAVLTLDSVVQLNHYFSQRPRIPYVLRIQGSDLLKHLVPPDPAYFPATRFGFTLEELKHIFQYPQVRADPPSGFHVHHGSERNQSSTYRSILTGLRQLADQLSLQPDYINLGGGWHSLGQEDMRISLAEARSVFPLPCNILIEPGRWYAEDAGFAVATIMNLTQTGATVKYTVNLSGRCHLHWSEARLIHQIAAGASKICEAQVFGASCFEADRIGKFLLPYHDDYFRESGLVPGKQIIFSGVSTYSAAWNTSFNGIPRASVFWWRP